MAVVCFIDDRDRIAGTSIIIFDNSSWHKHFHKMPPRLIQRRHWEGVLGYLSETEPKAHW